MLEKYTFSQLSSIDSEGSVHRGRSAVRSKRADGVKKSRAQFTLTKRKNNSRNTGRKRSGDLALPQEFEFLVVSN
jgi:hypothetical protein